MPTGGSSGPFVIERPKTLFNPRTRKYVCWFHLDTAGYKFRHAAVFESSSPTGPFAFVHALQPDGIASLDMSLFQDPVDHTAYFVRSCNNQVGAAAPPPRALGAAGDGLGAPPHSEGRGGKRTRSASPAAAVC